MPTEMEPSRATMCGARPLVALLAKNGGICVMVSNSTLPLGFLSIATIILLNGGRFLSSVLLSSVYLFPYTFLSNQVQRYNIILKYPRISWKKTIDGDEFIQIPQKNFRLCESLWGLQRRKRFSMRCSRAKYLCYTFLMYPFSSRLHIDSTTTSR